MSPLRHACLVLIALFSSVPVPTANAESEHGLNPVVEALESWLDDNAPWPRRDTAPTIQVLPSSLVTAIHPTGARGFGARRGFYDADTATVTLSAPWDPDDPNDRSVLLHELAHHRQAPLHWYCPAAQELPAYRLQAAWAAEHGAEPAIDWLRVVLQSGCTPRDIHPR